MSAPVRLSKVTDLPQLTIAPELRDLVPPLQAAERRGLEKDIVKYGGCHTPLSVWEHDGKLFILDGFNRHEICIRLNLPFEIKKIKALASQRLAMIWVVRNQLNRRNLTDFARIELAHQVLEPLLREEAKARQRIHGGTAPGRGKNSLGQMAQTDPVHYREELARETGASPRTVSRVLTIINRASPETKRQLRTLGDKSISSVAQGIINAERIAASNQRETQNPAEPDGTYDVLVADPPWETKIGLEAMSTPPYDQLRTEAIIEQLNDLLNVKNHAAQDAQFFLWTIQCHVEDAYHVVRALGFKPVQLITWCKPNSGFQPTGCAKSATEFLLYARRGSHPFRTTKGFKTYYEFKATGKHSEKPLEMYNELRRVTTGRRLDLYARRKIPGFDSWGRGTPERQAHDQITPVPALQAPRPSSIASAPVRK